MRGLAFLFIGLLFFGAADLGMRVTFTPMVPNPETGIDVEAFKCYVGNFTVLENGIESWTDSTYYLLDAKDPESLVLNLPFSGMRNYDALTFDLGVDSATSVAGVFGGDLDPTNGMYWTWNSGYVNFKLEGTHPQSAQVKKAITYHLGGYRAPHKTVRRITLPVKPEQEKIITIDLKRFLDSLDVANQYKVMSSGAEAARLSDLAARCFVLNENK